MKCLVCKSEIDRDIVLEEFEYIFSTADTHGVDALTEREQIVYQWRICSEECFEKLE